VTSFQARAARIFSKVPILTAYECANRYRVVANEQVRWQAERTPLRRCAGRGRNWNYPDCRFSATRTMVGAICFKISTDLPSICSSKAVKPVTLPSGCARLCAQPTPTGSVPPGTTMGIERDCRQYRHHSAAASDDVRIRCHQARRVRAHQIHVARGPAFVELDITAVRPSQPDQR